jgi:hypothetical protein
METAMETQANLLDDVIPGLIAFNSIAATSFLDIPSGTVTLHTAEETAAINATGTANSAATAAGTATSTLNTLSVAAGSDPDPDDSGDGEALFEGIDTAKTALATAQAALVAADLAITTAEEASITGAILTNLTSARNTLNTNIGLLTAEIAEAEGKFGPPIPLGFFRVNAGVPITITTASIARGAFRVVGFNASGQTVDSVTSNGTALAVTAYDTTRLNYNEILFNFGTAGNRTIVVTLSGGESYTLTLTVT